MPLNHCSSLKRCNSYTIKTSASVQLTSRQQSIILGAFTPLHIPTLSGHLILSSALLKELKILKSSGLSPLHEACTRPAQLCEHIIDAELVTSLTFSCSTVNYAYFCIVLQVWLLDIIEPVSWPLVPCWKEGEKNLSGKALH